MKSKRSGAQYISFSTSLPLWYDLSVFSDYSTWVGSRCESGTKILVWTGRKTDPVFGFFLKSSTGSNLWPVGVRLKNEVQKWTLTKKHLANFLNRINFFKKGSLIQKVGM